jgi:hypothetical protein
MRPKGYKQSRGQRQAISQGMHAYHARVKEALAHYLRLKKSIRVKKSTRVKRSTRVTKSPHLTATLGAAAIFLLVIGVVAAAMLMAAREPSPADIASIGPQPGKATAEASAKRASATTTPSAGVATATRPAADVAPAKAPAEPAATAPVPAPGAVTLTGCLERHDETFRLKDTTGLDAPKSRSWRSGFLKKGSTSIEVVDAAKRLKLTDHVGQRVSVMGVLVDREIHVHSLQRLSASCD